MGINKAWDTFVAVFCREVSYIFYVLFIEFPVLKHREMTVDSKQCMFYNKLA